jgi:hypothetical protein
VSQTNNPQNLLAGRYSNEYIIDIFKCSKLINIYKQHCVNTTISIAEADKQDPLESIRRATSALESLLVLDQSLKEQETDLLNEETSEYKYGPLIPLLLSSDVRTFVDALDWKIWVGCAQAGVAADTPMKLLCHEILHSSPSETEALTLRDLLEDPCALNLSATHINNVSMQLIVKCTAWVAYRNRYPEQTLERYLSNLGHISTEVNNLIENTTEDDEIELAKSWGIWTLMVSLRGDLDRKIGEIATLIRDNWPSNRFDETLREYLVKDRQKLMKRRGFGKKKLHTVTRCFAHAAVHGSTVRTNDNLAPFELIKTLNLPDTYSRCIELRYAESGGQTLEVCGRKMRLTRERIRQMESKVFEKVRRLGLADSMRKWAISHADQVWDDLSKSGALIRSDSFTESGYLRDKPELALAMGIANLGLSEILDLKGSRTEKGNWVYRE